MKLIVANRKGGVAKTTTAVHVAHALAISGRKVLLVDTDPQAGCSTMLGASNDIGLAELVLGTSDLDEAIQTVRPGLELLAGNRRLAQAARLITMKDYGKELVLSEILDDVDHDFVIVDTAPSLSEWSINTLFYGDAILTPVSAEMLSVKAISDLEAELRAIAAMKKITIRWVLPTMVDERKSLTEQIHTGLDEVYGDRLCDPVPTWARMAELPGEGITAFEDAPTSKVSQAYIALARRILDGNR